MRVTHTMNGGKTDQKSEKNVKKALIKSSNEIKRKYRELHRERLNLGEKVKEKYEPIIKPLNELISIKEKTTQNKNNESSNITQHDTSDVTIIPENNTNPIHEGNSNYESSSLNDLDEYLERVNQESPLHDTTYGIRRYRQSYMIGKNVVKFESGNLNVKKQRFFLTNGLKNLLFMKEPSGYSENDLQTYKDILCLTKFSGQNLSKQANQKSKNAKFVKIIQPLIVGSGIQLDYMRENKKKKIEYTYWDDPNELVERLMLLIASQQAGHTGHDNEIISIIEELREADIIE